MLAGGRSTRMGVDKAMMRVDGRPLVERPARALVDWGVRSLAIVGHPQAAAALALDVGRDLPVFHVDDLDPGSGPLQALIAGLTACPSPLALVLGCDMPSVQGAELTRLADAMISSPVEAAVSVHDGRRHFLHACFRADAAQSLRSAYATGSRSLGSGIDRLQVAEIVLKDPLSVQNWNDPSDIRG